MFRFRGVVSALGITLILSGCTKADTKPDKINGNNGSGESNATFQVKSLKGTGRTVVAEEIFKGTEDEGTQASSWQVPREATFTFNACILDRATRADAISQQFNVELPGRKLQITNVSRTGPNGCFSWMETIPFSFYVKKSRWIVVERDIVGTGHHTGRQRVRLALNPWALGKDARDHGEPVLFLRDDAFPKNRLLEGPKAEAAFGGEGLGEDAVFVDKVSVQTIRRGERDSGTLVEIKVAMEPKIRSEDAEGVPQFKPIASGDFKVLAHLVLTEAGDDLKDRMILSSAIEQNEKAANADHIEINGTGKVINGRLEVNFNAWIDPRMRQGNLELVLKVMPNVAGLRSFGGIYELASLRNLSSNMPGSLARRCRNADGCDTGDYLKKATNYDAVRAGALASAGSPYMFDRLKLRFFQVQPGETTTQRTVAYSASTCVVDAYTGDRLANLKFIVTYKNSKIPPLETSTAEDGCLNWPATIFHHYYAEEAFIPQQVTITKGTKTKGTGVSRDLKFYINPWDDKFTFGFDEREFTKKFWEKLKDRPKIPSRFFLADFGYHTVRFQYNIDSLMNLEVRKTVLMELQPQVLRYSGIINARKMTEPLRDGIWLMKVAIQKNYLDPARSGVVIDQLQNQQARVRAVEEWDGDSQARALVSLKKLGIEATTKEYISTETALVRVTDGVIIQPVEMRMDDLRMMRIRTNFLVQLEAVDERKLQMENAVRLGLQNEIDRLLEERRLNNEERKNRREELEQQGLDIAAIERAQDAAIKDKVSRKRAASLKVFNYISGQMNVTGAFDAVSWAPADVTEEDKDYIRRLLGYDVRRDEPENRDSAKTKLETNDFTNIKLPSCSDIDCNKFIEANSSLKKRTFVGPVIFLSNAYKDSVRATDNIDEARCGEKVEHEDPLERDLRREESLILADGDKALSDGRQNTFYKYSKYFGSLRHLCSTHVDDLINQEKIDRLLYEKSGPAVGSVYEFARQLKLEFLSLANEKPKSVEFTKERIEECRSDLVSCMQETPDRWIPAENSLVMVNSRLHGGRYNLSGPQRWWTKQPDDMKTHAWTMEDLRASIFDNKSPRSQRFAVCSILVSQIVEGAVARGAKRGRFMGSPQSLDSLVGDCMSSEEKVSIDRKLRVFKTGQDGDSYIFLGGLQLNLNVGQSFSVGRSEGYSWSWGAEPLDVLGFGGKNILATALKPLSLKAGWSHGFASSEGTSVSDSTYLVAQIARFKVRLDEYEQCVVLRLRPQFFKSVLNPTPQAGEGLNLSPSNPLLEISDFFHANKKSIEAHAGVLLCEGRRQTTPRYVKEDYFYFTQHFTEGDMLDQADLYNHPWLLPLRGQRDFGTLLHKVRAQEVVSFSNFVKGALPAGATRNIGWPLEQLLNVYKQITPSFPGFYTVLDDNEEMTQFPLEPRLSHTDADINSEVISPARRSPRQQQR